MLDEVEIIPVLHKVTGTLINLEGYKNLVSNKYRNEWSVLI